MKCHACGSEMTRTTHDIEAGWKGRQIIFRGLEAWVCRACGEEVYTPDDVRLMQSLMRGFESETNPPEVMNVAEVADLLRVSSQTVYSLARSGKLPSTKVGREWRFRRADVLEALRGPGSEHTALVE